MVVIVVSNLAAADAAVAAVEAADTKSGRV